jgi:hypothetical protein
MHAARTTFLLGFFNNVSAPTCSPPAVPRILARKNLLSHAKMASDFVSEVGDGWASLPVQSKDPEKPPVVN